MFTCCCVQFQHLTNVICRDYCYDDQVQVYGLTDEELYTALTTAQ